MTPVLTRAYSLLTIKAITDDRREFSGVATTPTPDRVGDVIEPLGVTFKNPLPLLLYHDSHQPVGTVKFDKPTKDGITFTAQIPAIAEPGRLKDRVDEAWQSVKARLVRGVSIGFRVLNDAMDFMKDTGGIRFRETEVLELSLVAVPANAEAVISLSFLKSYDVDRPAVLRTAAGVPSMTPGAAGTSQRDRLGVSSMTISEKLTAAKAALKTKSARLEELMTAADSAVLGDAEQAERTTLTKDVTALNADVETYAALEAAQMSQAKAIASPVQTDVVRPPHIPVDPPKLPPGIEMARYAICKMAALISRGEVTALEVARKRYPDQPRIQALIRKTAVDPMTTADGVNTGGTELVYATNLVSEFIDFLQPQTAIGKFGANGIPSLSRIPFNVRIPGQTSGGEGYWVGQAQQKGLKKFDFAAITVGFAKVAAISVLSDELIRFSSPSAESLVRNALAKSLIGRIDTDFVDPAKAAVANVSPASITNSIAGLTPSGTDAAAVRYDLTQLLAPFIAANISPSSGVIITSETVALTLSLMVNALGQREFPDITMRGGTLLGFPVITTQYCAGVGSPTGDILIFVNADDIYLADDGQVSIDASREASLEMDTSPGSPTESQIVSMYQNNLVALRAERYINWAKRRAAAVAWLADVWYVSGSPA